MRQASTHLLALGGVVASIYIGLVIGALRVTTHVEAAGTHTIQVGPGFSDVSPHQLVRTSGDVLYVVVPTCDQYPSCGGNTLRVYAGNQAGTPTGFTEQDSAHRPSEIGSSAVAIDGSDTLHVAWNDRSGNLNYRTFSTSAGTWSSTTVLASTGWTTFGQGDEGVVLALDARGAAHVAYTTIAGGTRRVGYVNKVSGNWSSPVVIDDGAIGNNQGAWHPTLALYPNGDVLLAWFVGSFNYTPDGTLYFRTRDHETGSWGTHATIAGDTLMTAIDNGPSLLITPDGTAHVTFLNAGTAANGQSTTGDYIHYYSSSGSGWVANHPGGGTQITHDPSLGLGPNGTVRIYGHGWQGGTIDGHGDDLYYFEGGGTTSWSGWTLYASGSFDSSVTTRWSQFFHTSPETLDIAYWADLYPNVLFAGTDVGASGGTLMPTPTSTPTDTLALTQTATPTLSASSTSTPPPTSSPTPTVTVPPASTPTATLPVPTTLCTPRPAVGLSPVPLDDGRLQVTVMAGRGTLRTIQYGTDTRAMSNAIVDVPDVALGNTNGFTQTLHSGVEQTTFFVRRQSSSQSTTVPLVIVDDCGRWETFVGGGPSAF